MATPDVIAWSTASGMTQENQQNWFDQCDIAYTGAPTFDQIAECWETNLGEPWPGPGNLPPKIVKTVPKLVWYVIGGLSLLLALKILK